MITDLAERKHVERQIRQLNRDLEHRVMERTQQLIAKVQELRAQNAERQRVELALRRQLETEQLIGGIATQLINVGPEEMAPAIHHTLAVVGRFIGADRGRIFMASDDGTVWSNTHEWCGAGIPPQITKLQRVPVQSVPWWHSQVQRREMVLVQHGTDLAREAAAEKQMLDVLGIQSVLAVPLGCGKSLAGFLTFDTTGAQKEWPEEECALIKSVAEILVRVFRRQRAEEAEHELRLSAEALCDTAESLHGAHDPDTVLERILENAGRVVPHDAATLMLIDQGTAHVVASHGFSDRGEQAALMNWRAPMAATPGLCEMTKSGTAFLLPDIASRPDWDTGWHTHWLESYLGVPIGSPGEIVGFLNLYSRVVGFFTAAHAHRLQTFAGQVGAALANARRCREAQPQSEPVPDHTLTRVRVPA